MTLENFDNCLKIDFQDTVAMETNNAANLCIIPIAETKSLRKTSVNRGKGACQVEVVYI